MISAAINGPVAVEPALILGPDTYYQLATLLDGASLALRDGAHVHHADSGRLTVHEGLVPGRYRHLQITANDVQKAELDDLPGPEFLNARLLKENLLYLPRTNFAFDVRLRTLAGEFGAIGLVCARLTLGNQIETNRRLRDKSRSVDVAHRRGLLDDDGRARADFRLNMKPVRAKFNALQDSAYVGQTQCLYEVIFAQWRALDSGDWVNSPLSPADDHRSTYIQFRQRQRRRGFQVADLFNR